MDKFDYSSLEKCGKNVLISSKAEIKRPHLACLGNNIAIDSGFYCTTKIILGDYTHISPYVTCIGGEEGIFEAHGFNNIMAGARIICVSDAFDETGLFGALIPKEFLGNRFSAPILMEAFSNIATNAIVLPGTKIREGVLVSIGSVIHGETEPWTVYKGNPARPVKKIDSTTAKRNAKALGYEFNY